MSDQELLSDEKNPFFGELPSVKIQHAEVKKHDNESVLRREHLYLASKEDS